MSKFKKIKIYRNNKFNNININNNNHNNNNVKAYIIL